MQNFTEHDVTLYLLCMISWTFVPTICIDLQQNDFNDTLLQKLVE